MAARAATAGRPWSGPDLRLLAFGFLLTLLSSFGQTFFIGLFGEQLRGTGGLGHATFGALYSAATLVSAACMFRVAAARSILATRCLLLAVADHVAILGGAL